MFSPRRLLFSILILTASAAGVFAQGRSYCNITSVVTRRLSNAVQITVRADGAMRVTWSYEHFLDMEALGQGQWETAGKRLTSLPFRIENARSKVPFLTDISIYPVSHVELSSPPTALEGIGLDLKMELYTPAAVKSIWIEEPDGLPYDESAGTTVTVQLSQDQTSLIFLVTSNKRIAPPLSLRKAPPGGPVEMTVSTAGENLFISALNAPLVDVLQAIAQRTGRQYLAEGAVDHIVSLYLDDVTVESAVQSLALAYGLAADVSDSVIRVAEATGQSIPAFVKSESSVVRCVNSSALSVRDSLPDFLLKFVRVDKEQNSVTVTGPAYLADKVRADVQALDQPIPVVEIEGTVVEYADRRDFEIAMGLGIRSGNDSLSANSLAGDLSFRSAGIIPEAFEERLHAMEVSGRGRIVARPRATALLGRTARLFVGQKKYITVLAYDMFENDWISKILGVDVGSSIDAKPLMVGPDGITLRLTPTVSNVAELEARTGLPTLFTRSATANVRIADGDTVIIGGLGMDQVSRSSRGIPGLDKLPLIGSLFRMPNRSKTFSQLAILVTARVRDAGASDSTVMPDTTGRLNQ